MIPSALLLALSLQAPTGYLVLDAEDGSRVLLGDRLLGSVPLGRTAIPAGELELTLERGKTKREINVNIAPNQTRYVQIGPKRTGYEGQRTPTAPPFEYCRRNPHVVGASNLIDRLDFSRAARRLQRAIEYAESCPSDVVRVYELKGYIDAINGERERAMRALETVRTLDPDFELNPATPAKITAIWEALPPPSKLRFDVPSPVERDGWIRIRGTTEDGLRLGDHVRIHVWIPNDPSPITRRVRLETDGHFETALPVVPGAGAIDVVLADRWGGTLRRSRVSPPD